MCPGPTGAFLYPNTHKHHIGRPHAVWPPFQCPGEHMRIVVAGAGEVGTASSKILAGAHDVETIDIASPFPTGHVDALVVAFRWSERFIDDVKELDDVLEPDVIVVHSTVPVGTCDAHGWVHAPVRGRHPHLVEGVATFPMHLGGHGAPGAAVLFEDAGVDTIVHPAARDTEAGKLWELAQLAIQVRVQHEMFRYCEQSNLDFDVVYTAFADSYNLGYSQLEPQFIRPVLDYIPGPLGGHCTAQNTPLLEDPFVDDMISPLLP